MTPIEKAAAAFIAVFRKEIGYHEKASNSQLYDKTANSGSNNYNKFAAHIDSLRAKGLNFYNGKKQSYEWCDVCYDDNMIVFVQGLGVDEIEAAKLAMKMLYQPSDSCGAGCVYSANYYRAANAWIERTGEPKTGDQFFSGARGNEQHTGAVTGVDDTYVYTVEGNANNCVMERRYKRTDSSIAGYGRPNFSLVSKYFEDEKPGEEMTAKQVEEIAKGVSEKVTEEKLEKSLGKMIYTIDDIPWESVKKEMRQLLDCEAIDGGTDYDINPNDINLPLEIVRAIVVAKRFVISAIKGALNNE